MLQQLKALNPFKIVTIDATVESTAEGVAKELEGVAVDLLINNAGIFEVGGLADVTKESLMKQFEVNAVGPLLVTRALLPNLKLAVKNNGGSAIVAHVSSYMGSIAKNDGGYYNYRASKAGLNMVNSSLSIDLKGDGIAAVVLHPGYVVTNLTGGLGDVHTDESVAGMTAVLDKVTLADTGKFFHFQGQEIEWRSRLPTFSVRVGRLPSPPAALCILIVQVMQVNTIFEENSSAHRPKRLEIAVFDVTNQGSV